MYSTYIHLYTVPTVTGYKYMSLDVLRPLFCSATHRGEAETGEGSAVMFSASCSVSACGPSCWLWFPPASPAVSFLSESIWSTDKIPASSSCRMPCCHLLTASSTDLIALVNGEGEGWELRGVNVNVDCGCLRSYFLRIQEPIIIIWIFKGLFSY